jgi:hypothetical protein
MISRLTELPGFNFAVQKRKDLQNCIIDCCFRWLRNFFSPIEGGKLTGVFESGVLRRIFESKRNEVARE